MRNLSRTGSGRLLLAVSSTLLITGAGLSGTAIASAGTAHAPARPAVAVNRTATVVKKATRHHFGRIIVTVRGRALYYLTPHHSCTGQCLSVWPRLVMPAGKTIPKGAPCLGTKAFGTHHRLQVTYHKQRLYTFVSDSGTSVTGDGIAGFKVAKVVRGC
ncbi:MAG TPA: hypothetical protein VGI66_16975 [Streptosporangiaceae bacterium]